MRIRAAEAMLAGEDATMPASMAKLKAGRAMREVTDACRQYRGRRLSLGKPRVARLP